MVYIILLNWNGWKDTVHCLESIFRSDYSQFRVILCDNLSTDGSMGKIRAWADGGLTNGEKLVEPLGDLVSPPVKKPVPYVQYWRGEAEAGGKEDSEFPLVLIQNGSNNGYSAGNNVGIRYALTKGADYIWLLNNDTVIAGDALSKLVAAMENNEKTGALGTSIYFASNPSELQTYGGGRIGSFLGVDRFSPFGGTIDYVAGTSLFVRREVVEQVGVLDDEFFFYWEDVDYSKRILSAGWQLGVVEKALIYHKFSASVGGQTLRSDLYKVSSLIRYFRKHHPYTWPIPVKFNLLGMILNRINRKQLNRIAPIIKQAINAIKKT